MELKIEVEDELVVRIKEFKKIFDSIMGEDSDFNDYVTLLIHLGLEKMLRDAIPEGQEWLTLQYMFEKKPEMVSDFISGVWKEIKEEEKEKMKEVEMRMKKSVERYIN